VAFSLVLGNYHEILISKYDLAMTRAGLSALEKHPQRPHVELPYKLFFPD
jgi:hypothetical protein